MSPSCQAVAFGEVGAPGCVGCPTAGPPGVVEQHEREQPGHLGVVDGDRGLSGEPERVLRPAADRLDPGILYGVLVRREVGSATDEGVEHARSEAPERDLVHGRARHSVMVGGVDRNRRSSSHSWIGLPPAPGAADSSPASSTARS